MSEIKQNPLRIIGTWAPSSRAVAVAMTRFVSSTKKQRILEVGAGTGAITKQIIKSKGPEHQIDVVEIFPVLADVLRRRFGKVPGVNIHGMDILKFEPDYKYDLIISSLPFNSLVPEVVGPIINRLSQLADHHAIMSFFEYKVLQNLVMPFLGKEQLASYQKTRGLIEHIIDRFQFDEVHVKLNIPPTLVHYLKMSRLDGT